MCIHEQKFTECPTREIIREVREEHFSEAPTLPAALSEVDVEQLIELVKDVKKQVDILQHELSIRRSWFGRLFFK